MNFSMDSVLKRAAIYMGALFLCLIFSPLALADEYHQLMMEAGQEFTVVPQSSFSAFALSFEEEDLFHVHKEEEHDHAVLEYFTMEGWKEVPLMNEGDRPSTDISSRLYSHLIFVDPQEKLLLRGELSQEVEIVFFDTRFGFSFSSLDTEDISLASLSNLYDRDIQFYTENNIIPREYWGADESFRYKKIGSTSNSNWSSVPQQKTAKQILCEEVISNYPEDFKVISTQSVEGGNDLRWNYQYASEIKKIVVHHTAESSVGTNKSSDEIIRGIYNYHTNSLGWGDIGYNYLIDAQGRIYEGRAGGDMVVAGHAYCNNIGTIGIAMMGNFQNEEPSEAQVFALKNLLLSLSQKYQLDLTDSSVFHGEDIPNLLGHRDVGQTLCPGENLYNQLDDIRDFLKAFPLSTNSKNSVSAELVSDIPFLDLEIGETRSIKLGFKNTGTTTWKEGTWLHLQKSSKDIGVSMENGSEIKVQSLSSNVEPGQVAFFTVSISAGEYGGLHTLTFSPVVDGRKLPVSAVVPVQSPAIIPRMEVENFSFDSKDDEFEVFYRLKNTGNITWEKGVHAFELEIQNTIYEIPLEKSVKPGESIEISHWEDRGRMSRVKIQLSLTKNKKNVGSIVTDNRSIFLRRAQEVEIEFDHPQRANRIYIETQEGKVANEIITLKNTGTKTWYAEDMLIGVFGAAADRRPVMTPDRVRPGETATFQLQTSREVNDKTNLRIKIKYEKKIIRSGRAIVSFLPVKNLKITPDSSQEDFSLDAVGPIGDDRNIRIRLGFGLSTAEVSGMKRNQSFVVVVDDKVQGVETDMTIQIDGKILKYNGKIVEKIQLRASEGEVLEMVNWERRPSWNQSLNDNLFRGTLEFRLIDGELVVINELSVQDYLKGVAEVSNDAPTEKQKAIAIVARTYARYYLDPSHRKFPNMPYDGNDNPNAFQIYLGYGYEKRSPDFSKIVEETKNMVLTYEDQLIKTPFFSQSDGRTRSAQELWGWENTPYLISVDDTWCKGGKGVLKGHGVGLSGCGAQTMAEEGKSVKEILQYYYPGTKLEERIY